jgi:hypothetical protein
MIGGVDGVDDDALDGYVVVARRWRSSGCWLRFVLVEIDWATRVECV